MGGALFARASGFGRLFEIVEAEQGVEALRRLRRQSGFHLENFTPTTLIPFPVMNRVFNLAAKLTGDHQLGARVGQNIRAETFGPFAEYSLRGETLGHALERGVRTHDLHSNQLTMDLRVVGRQARWRVRYQTRTEPTVEHDAQRSLMVMLSTFNLYPGASKNEIEIHVAEPYAPEARLLESRVGLKVWPRANDYELEFPAAWLNHFTPIAGLPPNLPVEALAAYGDRPLPRRTAEAVLIALELHRDMPIGGVDLIAAEIGLAGRTLQRALRSEGVSYREIVLSLRMRRGRELLATTAKPLAEVALRAGYADPSNFHRAFLLQTGMTPGRFREALRSPATSQAE